MTLHRPTPAKKAMRTLRIVSAVALATGWVLLIGASDEWDQRSLLPALVQAALNGSAEMVGTVYDWLRCFALGVGLIAMVTRGGTSTTRPDSENDR